MTGPNADVPPEVPELIPARMLNEHTYCPRLAYLEWVQGDFADSADTVEGRFHHRKVDREAGALPAEDGRERVHARSVLLSASRLGFIARIDVVEAEGDVATPVDYKRGEAPDVPGGAWEPERVQVCAQAMILEENGFRVPHGIIYFVASRQRVQIELDDTLRRRTLELADELRQAARQPAPPPPLRDSPKCPRCSLVGICLPDETNLLLDRQADDHDDAPGGGVRRLLPARDDALPLYVKSAGARISKSGHEMMVEDRDGNRQTVRLAHTSQVAIFGAVQVTTQTIQTLCDRGIPVCYFSSGGWFYGITRGMDHKNVDLRRAQYRAADDPTRSLALARRLVVAKIRNCRTLVRRNAERDVSATLDRLRELVDQAAEAESAGTLLGLEGTAARLYFEQFGGLIRRQDGAGLGFDFDGRNRRPPRDPINALLSFAYALLTKELALAAMAIGFDPYLGFYHRPRYGRPALALDVMEEFRPLIADSVVLSAVNTGVIQPADFVRRGAAVALTDAGRGKFLRAYERRMDELVTHPVFGYRVSYRRILEVQLRLLARHLGGELAEYPSFVTR